MTFHKFLVLWAVLVVAGFGWDMGKALSRRLRARVRRWWRKA